MNNFNRHLRGRSHVVPSCCALAFATAFTLASKAALAAPDTATPPDLATPPNSANAQAGNPTPAQGSTLASAANSNSPAPAKSFIDGLKVRAGYVIDKSGHSVKGSEFHEVILKNQSLSKKGDEPSNSNALADYDFTKNAAEKAVKNGFFLDLASGSGKVNSSILNYLGKDKFSIPTPHLRGWTGVTRLDGLLNGKEINGAIGWEGPPRSGLPLPIHGLGRANWLIPGIAVNEAYKRNGKDEATGQLTMRMFSGVYTTQEKLKVEFSWDDVLDEAKDLQHLKLFKSTNPKDWPQDVSLRLGEFLSEQASLMEEDHVTPDKYEATLKDNYEGHVQGFRLVPVDSFWLESDARYAFVGDHEGRRFSGLLALVGTHRFSFKKDGSFSNFELRGEYGHDRATPDQDLVRLKASLSHAF